MSRTGTSTSRKSGDASKVATRKAYAKPDLKKGPKLAKVTALLKGSPAETG